MYKLKTIGKKASYFSGAEKIVARAENDKGQVNNRLTFVHTCYASKNASGKITHCDGIHAAASFCKIT